MAVLQVRVEMLEAQLARERDTVDDLRKRLDRSEERVLTLTAEPKPSPAPSPIAPAPKRPSGLLARLFGRA